MRSGHKNIKDQLTATTRKVSVKKHIVREEKSNYFDSANYWETRYQNGGNSGDGSYGVLAEYKAEFINNFIKKNNITSLLEYGCGDCNQLEIIHCERIIGVDVSSECIQICKNKLPNHNFFVLNKNKKLTKTKVDLIVSLDVLYHLIEDIVYENYIKNLFNSESKFIIIYSCNFEDDGTFAKHVKPRKFTDHQFINQKYDLIHFEKNKYGDKKNTDTYSMSDWYIYKIKE